MTDQPVSVPGGNTDPATDPVLVPLFIGAILAYHDADQAARAFGGVITGTTAQVLANVAHRQLLAAAATILRTRGHTP